MDKTAVKNAQGHKPVSDATAPWHGLSVAQVHESLGSTDCGLSTEQANEQQAILGGTTGHQFNRCCGHGVAPHAYDESSPCRADSVGGVCRLGL